MEKACKTVLAHMQGPADFLQGLSALLFDGCKLVAGCVKRRSTPILTGNGDTETGIPTDPSIQLGGTFAHLFGNDRGFLGAHG